MKMVYEGENPILYLCIQYKSGFLLQYCICNWLETPSGVKHYEKKYSESNFYLLTGEDGLGLQDNQERVLLVRSDLVAVI